MPEPLTRKQAEVYAFIRQFIVAHEYAPSLEEIGAATSGVLATTFKHLENLTRKGWIRRRHNVARSIELLGVEPGVCPHCRQAMK